MPTLGSSSTTAGSSSPSQTQVSEPANLNYAFLIHSQKTLTQNLPPRVDNKLLARQKRRRTSPEDHAILEAEYKTNPKPDKVARASIVSRVALGEKEVQVWFQNRRQNDRRKSKPLEPHELVGPRASTSNADSSPDNRNSGPPEPSFSFGSVPSDDPVGYLDVDGKAKLDASKVPADILVSSSDGPEVDLPSSQVHGEIPSSQTTRSLCHPSEILQETPQELSLDIVDHNKAVGILAELTGLGVELNPRKRALSTTDAVPQAIDVEQPRKDFKSPPSLRISMSFDGEALVRHDGEPTPSPPKPRTAVRISLSSDGEALVRGEDEPSPSKNRMRMIPSRTNRQSGLKRSTSAVTFGSSQIITDREGFNRLFGRSRDARMWELYCDTDARSALSTPGGSQSGNSAPTPGLNRSGSNRSLVRTNSFSKSLCSTRPEAESHSTSVEYSSKKRRKLGRTVSSLGRLESVQRVVLADHSAKKPVLSDGKTFKDYAKEVDWEAGDSDKENWVPGTQQRAMPGRHRRVNSHAPRPVLRVNGVRKNTAVDDLALAANGKRGRVSRGGHCGNKENELYHPAKIDAEVAAFMSKTSSSSREEDLDCIQGLLSLSQGAWK
ncbi:hypothetical protein BGW36DRAFT_426923 [Talaromyces proteolyticus]|uniref:Homeobox domain-containing protein n=1 Tax=Talaromyces proteolyticus TaxID=1131652 RepID=A0AAD4PXE5_9EURO|nr:uncharacterized protein BGW36DRAFT_426923 [Talaromyces proteolyticus]KAH8699252.1 hypothetical protein BGW36DRAFT_426923 [Talaromyces proteolyticus]